VAILLSEDQALSDGPMQITAPGKTAGLIDS
jgi:hypothetical protein